MTDEPAKPCCAEMRAPPKTVAECAEIAHAEFVYWKEQAEKSEPNTDAHGIGMSGMGAAANIYAAITIGAMAPWHPKPKT